MLAGAQALSVVWIAAQAHVRSYIAGIIGGGEIEGGVSRNYIILGAVVWIIAEVLRGSEN